MSASTVKKWNICKCFMSTKMRFAQQLVIKNGN